MPQPRSDIRFLEATPDRRGYLVEIVGGAQDGTLVFIPGPPPRHLLRATVTDTQYVAAQVRYVDLPPTAQREAQATAERLLLSLLDDVQQADYRASGGFWVELADLGRLRLGTLYHLVHRPASGPVVEQILCVVPTGDLGAIPPADIWTNLLLALTHDPAGFLAKANVIRTTDLKPGVVGATFDSVDADQLATLAASHYRAGDWWNGAVAESTLGERHVQGGRHREALRCAVPAALTLLAAERPEHAADEERTLAIHRASILIPVARTTPGFIVDLLDLADQRMRCRRRDLSARIDAARDQLASMWDQNGPGAGQ